MYFKRQDVIAYERKGKKQGTTLAKQLCAALCPGLVSSEGSFQLSSQLLWK